MAASRSRILDFQTCTPVFARFKNAIQVLVVLPLLYALVWAFAEHGHTYTLIPAKQRERVWVCDDGVAEGPFWDHGKDRDPVCHYPVRQCPVLWLPFVTEVPCTYKDPLGGPYTKEDMFILEQAKHRRSK
jgi:hypothetical protein